MKLSDIKRVTVYLGSSGRCRPIFKETAKELGLLIGKEKKTLVYGGMDSGLMGIIANNALAAKARVIGVIPKNLKDSERIHPSLNETILVPDLWERKLKMFRRADAILVLPGGFGTLDEMTEVLHWADCGLHRKPIVLVNTEGYWDPLIEYLQTLPDYREEFLRVTDSVAKVFNVLKSWNTPEGPSEDDPAKFPHFEDEILRGSKDPLIFDNPTIKNTYILATALGLKQLDKHARPIGILNKDKKFSSLVKWIERAQKEHFISDRCTQLFSVDEESSALKKKLSEQKHIHIDLDQEKWGPSETATHIELQRKN
ncbi:MAG: TIGR00730 family Rossman fold protein [Alphaproteobacteria bacterium]|nr:TIGR00730 family Rossman fold protein [Alphaproteobacteria bacterium]MCB1839216.1 TIGR00730 family Rossman fold protein [Alphaproteobacteria bacterium]